MEDNPEFCPTLSHVVQPDVLLPGITSRGQQWMTWKKPLRD
jgi:hypothetical protein